jgi:hypothetical protein
MGFHKLGTPIIGLFLQQFIAWGKLRCPDPLKSKTQQNHISECGLGVERWVQAWKPKQGGN